MQIAAITIATDTVRKLMAATQAYGSYALTD